jgi:hypothetical protein
MQDINICFVPGKVQIRTPFFDRTKVKKILIGGFTINGMDNKTSNPGILRIAAAIILGAIVGFILFLVVALFIGVFNDHMGMNIPVSTDVAENIFSAVILVIFELGSIIGFCWKVWVTPPTEEVNEELVVK